MNPIVSAVILAAGMSRRMGALKQLVRVGNRTLLEHTLDAVRGSRVAETILVLGYHAEEITEKIVPDKSVRIVINEAYADGMSTSIRAGLQAVPPEASAALIVLADQPFLKSDVIDQLISEHHSSHAAILYPVYKGFRGNPVLIDRSLFPEMMQITGDIGCRSLFGIHSTAIRKVPVEDIGILIDIDTAEDLENALAQNRRSSSEIWKGLDLEGREEQKSPELPGRQLLIVGDGDVPRALMELGNFLKFRITVIDPLLQTPKQKVTEATRRDVPSGCRIVNELDLSKIEIAPSTCIVVASRGKFDEEALEQSLRTEAGYIALVGSKKRGAEIVQRLSSAASETPDARIRFPAGLKIGASTPEEIAVSILAEIISLKNGS